MKKLLVTQQVFSHNQLIVELFCYYTHVCSLNAIFPFFSVIDCTAKMKYHFKRIAKIFSFQNKKKSSVLEHFWSF